MEKFLRVAETYLSLQGEGSHSGLPCFFIRTAGCDLRCTWCDTPGALEATSGEWMSRHELFDRIPDWVTLVQLTGGEPLLQRKAAVETMETLIARGKKILLETGGHKSVEGLPSEVHVVLDVKLPGSGEDAHDFAANFVFLKKTDEIKFVVEDRRDFDRACRWMQDFRLADVCQLLMSPVSGKMDPAELAAWILESRAPVRMQIQLHKIIWGANAQGV